MWTLKKLILNLIYMDEQFLKRLRSLLWRALCVALIAGIAFLIQSISGLEIPDYLKILLGLILGEVSKYFNSNQDMFGMLKK